MPRGPNREFFFSRSNHVRVIVMILYICGLALQEEPTSHYDEIDRVRPMLSFYFVIYLNELY